MARTRIDLRSDTVTKPSEAMHAAMKNAEVDDEVMGYDPTAARLEEEMARVLGNEAALFAPTGTMANLLCVLTHCQLRGSEVILGQSSHLHLFESGSISTIGGVHPRTVKNNEDGTMDIKLIEESIRDQRFEICFPKTRLICLENSHTVCGGRCLSVEYTDQVGELANKYGLKLHIDGSRIFNASVALGVPVHRLVQAADSVMVCLSKGLGAPAGSIIAGSKTFISKAKILRKGLGGSIRKVGMLCAAGLVSIQQNISKLENDHKNAKSLAVAINNIRGLKVDVSSVETNIVHFDILEDMGMTADEMVKKLEANGILALAFGSRKVRVVTHHQISESDVEYTVSCVQKIVNGFPVLNGGI